MRQDTTKETKAVRFNPDAPHGEVFGLPGVRYEQAGRLFNSAGEDVTARADEVVE